MKRILIIPVIAVLGSCTGRVTDKVEIGPPDNVAPIGEPDTLNSGTPVSVIAVPSDSGPAIQAASRSGGESFASSGEAYDEGYTNGEQDGYSDALYNLEYGYNYNDEPEYTGFIQYYEQGYEDGYIDGYNAGVAWNNEND